MAVEIYTYLFSIFVSIPFIDQQMLSFWGSNIKQPANDASDGFVLSQSLLAPFIEIG